MAKPIPTMQIRAEAEPFFRQRVFSAISSINDPITAGPYANDAAAAAGGVPLGGQYYKPTGEVFVRLT